MAPKGLQIIKMAPKWPQESLFPIVAVLLIQLKILLFDSYVPLEYN